MSFPFLVLADFWESQVARNLQIVGNVVLCQKLLAESSNLDALPTSLESTQVTNILVTRSSGAFPAILIGNTTNQSCPSPSLPPDGTSPSQESDNTHSVDTHHATNHPQSNNSWKYIMIVAPSFAILCRIALSICIMCQRPGGKTILHGRPGSVGSCRKHLLQVCCTLDITWK